MEAGGGVQGFIQAVEKLAKEAPAGWRGTVTFILQMADAYAYIRLRDLAHPLRFLRQMAGRPPVQFGTEGFRPELVDDPNPARHYTAFVFVGFWLPYPLALAVLWLWEIAGFFRYRGHWSWPDLRNGRLGIRHGRMVRLAGPFILPTLIARDLATSGPV